MVHICCRKKGSYLPQSSNPRHMRGCCHGYLQSSPQMRLSGANATSLEASTEGHGTTHGQLDPNIFLHVNVFQAHCLAVKVRPRPSLFWYHYDFHRNPKIRGFYTIARRNNIANWAQTNSNNKGSHDEWFFFSGPNVAKFSTWRDVDPTKIVMRSFGGADENTTHASMSWI